MKKLYLEDLAVGQKYSSGEYTLTEENIKKFASEYDPQPFHLDEQSALAHPVFQGLAGSGWQTAAITMRLWVESFPVAGGLVGFGGEVSWKRPTRPNDVLHVESEITELRRSQSKPNQGVITLFSQTKNQNDEVDELKEDRDGLAEAYLTWKNDLARVTIGNQRLNLPFMGDYADRRVLMYLYQAADVQVGNNTDFLRLTKVNKYKSYGEDEFTKTSRQNSNIETDGLWSFGLGKSFDLASDKKLKAQLWYQDYDDYTRLIYTQADLSFPKLNYSPEFSVQYISGKDQGKALAGEVNSQIFGAQAALKVLPKASLKVAYNYIKPDSESYLNGALLTPYATKTSSGEIFAQPFFTSTQDLGAGNAFLK